MRTRKKTRNPVELDILSGSLRPTATRPSGQPRTARSSRRGGSTGAMLCSSPRRGRRPPPPPPWCHPQEYACVAPVGRRGQLGVPPDRHVRRRGHRCHLPRPPAEHGHPWRVSTRRRDIARYCPPGHSSPSDEEGLSSHMSVAGVLAPTNHKHTAKAKKRSNRTLRPTHARPHRPPPPRDLPLPRPHPPPPSPPTCAGGLGLRAGARAGSGRRRFVS